MAHTNTFAPHAVSGGPYRLPSLTKGSRLVVVGAGAFGGWIALHALRIGMKVTLVDAWGPGNARASSGDETRVIRSTYGANETYFDLNVRALALWKENEKHFGRKLFFNTGVLWLCHDEHAPLVDESVPFTHKHHMLYEQLSHAEIMRRFPLVHADDLHHAFFDPYGGYLKAREACQAVCEAFVVEGGHYLQHHATPGIIKGSKMHGMNVNGATLEADFYVFAAGAWMPRIFPDVLDNVIACSRQEVYYFGVPATAAKAFDAMPVWVDVDGRDFYYGIPGNAYRGFKLGVDIRGPAFDPTQADRLPNNEVLAAARTFMAHRFPALKHAPLLESRVCPYENSRDGNFVVQVHPDAGNVLLVGGGSGHGFKHGPALGESIVRALVHGAPLPAMFNPLKQV